MIKLRLNILSKCKIYLKNEAFRDTSINKFYILKRYLVVTLSFSLISAPILSRLSYQT